MTIHEHLRDIDACLEARNWASKFSSAERIWDVCSRLPWLVWWDVRVHGRAGLIRLLDFIEESCCRVNQDPRVRRAFQVARRGNPVDADLVEAAEAVVGAVEPTQAAAWAAKAVVEAAESVGAALSPEVNKTKALLAAAVSSSWAVVWAATVAPHLNPNRYREAVACPWREPWMEDVQKAYPGESQMARENKAPDELILG